MSAARLAVLIVASIAFMMAIVLWATGYPIRALIAMAIVPVWLAAVQASDS